MRTSYLTLALSFLLVAVAHAQQPAAAILPADVRLVIDVSGSMKRTDPNNLRKPAMELLIQLLPDNSRAGIWTFGQSVNLLVPHRTVNAQWRAEAATKTQGINSVALFTHIGAALEQAAYDAGRPSPFRNNIILLTDGVVDIDPAADVNSRERQRILTELLPRLRDSGYIVHTIALSDEADKALMEDLSTATDGVFATVSSADELMSTFLRIFDQAVPLERLPLDNNHFLVDAAVEEFTALIFRKAGAEPTRLLAPDGQSYTAVDVPNAIRWHRGPNYDLITATQPVAGQWQVEAEIDPNNRVTVVSNLQLVTTPLPNNIEVSEPVSLDFYLQEDEASITDPQFLQLLALDAIITRISDGRQWQLPLVNPVPPIDGRYHHPLELFRETGIYSIQLMVDGTTFKREYKHQLTVGSPFTVRMEKRLENNQVAYVIDVNADDQRVDSAKTFIVAHEKNSEGGNALHNFVQVEPGKWQLIFFPATHARYSLGLQVSGVRADNSPVNEILATQYFTYPDVDDPIPVAGLEVEAEPPVSDAVLEEQIDTAPAPEVESENTNAWLLYASVGLANVLVLVLAYLGFRMIVGKKAKDEMDELEQALNVDVDKLVAEKKAQLPGAEEAPLPVDKTAQLPVDKTAQLPMQELDAEKQQVIDLADQLNEPDIDFNGPTLTDIDAEAPAEESLEAAAASAEGDAFSDLESEFPDFFEDPGELQETKHEDDEATTDKKNSED
jgi:uncharacterized protein YegL